MRFVEGEGFIYPALHLLTNSTSAITYNINASGDGVHFIGELSLRLDDPGGVSKTISAAGGGRILVRRSGATPNLNNSGTTIRIGLQDVDKTTDFQPIGDRTFTVYHESIGGSSTLDTSDNLFYLMGAPMHVGSKTLTHGELVAVCLEMPTRGGTDSVVLIRTRGNNPFFGYTVSSNVPSLRTGTSLTNDSSYNALQVIIEFDDGTIGVIAPYVNFYDTFTTSLSNSTTPDELGNVITVSSPMLVQGVLAQTGAYHTQNLKYCLYKDPFSSNPTLVAEITRDYGGVSNQAPSFVLFDSPVLLQPGEYVLSLQPQGPSTHTINRTALSDPNYYYVKDSQGIGVLHYAVERNGRTGPFTRFQVSGRDQIIHLALLQSSVAVPTGISRFNMGI